MLADMTHRRTLAALTLATLALSACGGGGGSAGGGATQAAGGEKLDVVVGFREVTIPARAGTSTSDPVQLDVDIRTTQLAASGHVESCWYVS